MNLLAAIDLSPAAISEVATRRVLSKRTEKEGMLRQIVLEANAKKLVLIVLSLLQNLVFPGSLDNIEPRLVRSMGSLGEESC
jgi:hypothetical protein